MAKKIIFNGREPIGSSTYPMPANIVDYEKQLAQLAIPAPSNNRTSTMYIHIPFCDQICSFCGFNKFLSGEDRKEIYIKSLLKEMELYSKQKHVSSLDIRAVYLGGGTPNSLSSEQMDRVLKHIHSFFNLAKDCEITCEGTPQNFTEDRIHILKQNNVKRISAGIQTVNHEIRKEHLHMNHKEKEILTFIERIRNNFDNFNLDFIYNLPRQTEEIWQHDIEIALASQATHLTTYPLVLLEKTRFYSDYIKLKKHEIPCEEKEIKLFNMLIDPMSKAGFNSYSIRDWCKSDKRCQYIDYNAKCSQVLAFGAGSHGYIAGTTYRNERNLKTYSEMLDASILPIDQHQICSKSQLMQRFMVMGLRLFALNMQPFRYLFDCNWRDIFGEKINHLVESGYLLVDGDMITHTEDGHIWANNIRTYFEESKGASVGYTDSVGVDHTGKSHYSQISRIKASADVEAHS